MAKSKSHQSKTCKITNMKEEFFTAQELADKLKLNVMTIYRYIKSGKLIAYKIGKEFRISEKDFNSFIKASKM